MEGGGIGRALSLAIAAVITVVIALAAVSRVSIVNDETNASTTQGGEWGSTEVFPHSDPPTAFHLRADVGEDALLAAIHAVWPDLPRLPTLPEHATEPFLAVEVQRTGGWTPLRTHNQLTLRSVLFSGSSEPAAAFGFIGGRLDGPRAPGPYHASFLHRTAEVTTVGLFGPGHSRRKAEEALDVEGFGAWVREVHALRTAASPSAP